MSPAPPLGRVCTAMATPMHADETLDLDGAQRLAAHLVEHGSETVLIAGTTGESPTLRGDEPWELLEAVVDAVGDRAKVMMGTGTNDTLKTVKATQRATELGADAILVVTPYYNKPHQPALLRHFTTVAEATDKPVVLYDIPGRTSREIERDTLVELAEVPNIVGVKDAVGDLQKTAEVAARTPADFHVYCGDDGLNLPMLAVGATGFVSVASHLAGDELADMARIFDNDPVKAREIHLRLLPLYRALFLEPNPAPLKGALDRVGLPGGPVRGPLVPAGDDTVDAVLDGLRTAGVALP